MPTLPPIDRKWRSRALNSETPADLPHRLMCLGPQLDAALNVPDPAARVDWLRDVLDELEQIGDHVRAAARKAQAQLAVTR